MYKELKYTLKPYCFALKMAVQERNGDIGSLYDVYVCLYIYIYIYIYMYLDVCACVGVCVWALECINKGNKNKGVMMVTKQN
jgi:hypothetical protein